MTKIEQLYAVLEPAMQSHNIDNTPEDVLYFLTKFREDLDALPGLESIERDRWKADVNYEIVRLKLVLGLNLAT